MVRKNRSLSGKAENKRNMTGETKAEASEAVKGSKKKVRQSPSDAKVSGSLEDGFQFEGSEKKVSESPGHSKDTGSLEDVKHGFQFEGSEKKVSESPGHSRDTGSLEDVKHGFQFEGSEKKVSESPGQSKDTGSLEDVKHGFQFEGSEKKMSESLGQSKDTRSLEDVKHGFQFEGSDKKVSESPGQSKDTGSLEDVNHGFEGPRKKVSESPEEDEKESGSLQDVKHPLMNSWGFWMNTNLNKKQWETNIVELTKFGTVEDFWCLYHHMKPPSELIFGQDYSVFKNNTRPMWEDEANKKGGRWLIPVERRKDLDWMWLDVVLLMIGENFENNDLICGAVVNVRGKCKISVWTADSTKENANKEIGRKLKNQLRFQGKLGFQLHDSQVNLYMV